MALVDQENRCLVSHFRNAVAFIGSGPPDRCAGGGRRATKASDNSIFVVADPCFRGRILQW